MQNLNFSVKLGTSGESETGFLLFQRGKLRFRVAGESLLVQIRVLMLLD